MRGLKRFFADFVTLVARTIAKLPFAMLYLLSDFIFFVGYRVVGYRKKVVRKNLHLAFPEKSDEERLQIEKKFYRHFCDVVVETLKLLSHPDEWIDRRVIVENAELVDRNVEAGRSTILLLGHYGNWEWVPAITRHFRKKQIFAQIYSPLKDPEFSKVVRLFRNRFGAENIPKNKAFRRLLEIQRDGEHFVTGFIADQRPLGRNLHHWTTFMGVDTAYMVGGETIGERLNAAYLYLDVEKTGRGYYKLTFKELYPVDDNEPYPVTRAYFAELERTIKRQPPYWLWTHNRWKASRMKGE